MATFSFHPVKTIATGEGGMVTTNDAGLAERLRTLRSHGMVRPEGSDPWWYEMPEPGFNYRLPDILCALGLSQLAKLDRFAARRRALARAYQAALAPLAPLVRPAAQPAWSDPVLHLMCVLIDFQAAGLTRRAVVDALRERGVGTQVHYIPVHRQPYYRARYGDLRLPGAEAWYDRCLSLPLYPGMADGDVGRVAKVARSLAQALAFTSSNVVSSRSGLQAALAASAACFSKSRIASTWPGAVVSSARVSSARASFNASARARSAQAPSGAVWPQASFSSVVRRSSAGREARAVLATKRASASTAPPTSPSLAWMGL